jgi:hypothetical protein
MFNESKTKNTRRTLRVVGRGESDVFPSAGIVPAEPASGTLEIIGSERISLILLRL